MDNKPAGRKKIPGKGNGSSLVAFQNELKANKNPNLTYEKGVTLLTIEEVNRHKTPSDCWTVISGVVYNISPFMEYHPGGFEELMKGAGCDCTTLYMKYHPWVNADAVLGTLRLGRLVDEKPIPDTSTQSPFQRISESTAPMLGDNTPSPVYDRARVTINTSFGSPPTSPVKFHSTDILGSSIGIFRSYNAVRK